MSNSSAQQNPLLADVILPLALPKLLTYFIPPEWNDEVGIGQRVVVQLQKEKLYTGIIAKLHHDLPESYEVKPIASLLDTEPIIHHHQLRFWEWLAEYYMCSLGEVMTAALPGGLKLNSESKIMAADWKADNIEKLSDKEYLVMEALEVRPYLSMPDVQHILGIKTIQPVLKSLIDKGCIHIEQELKQKYKPRFEFYIELSEFADQEENLKIIFDELVKAPKQLEALMVFVHLTSRYTHKIRAITKPQFLSDARVTGTAVKELIKKGILVEIKKEVGRFEFDEVEPLPLKPLSGEQKRALGEIEAHFSTKEVALLHGVTSSGKTEIYLKLIQDAVQSGKQVLYLLPEIALTGQLIQRVQQYFPGMVGVYHSKFNENERVEVWNHVLTFDPYGERQRFQIILGARSSLFLPFKHLGLIIIDEEHDSSFKQHDPSPRYHARDAAIYLGSMQGCKVLLGSATPSIESMQNAKKGKYGLVEMLSRYGDVKLPKISVIDLKKSYRDKKMKGHFSEELIEQIQHSLEKREQVMLFQNRRGFSVVVQCITCGHVPHCLNCDITLTYHKNSNQLRCHYCGYQIPKMEQCIKCASADINTKGFGTEKIEEELAEIFPTAGIARLDLDTTRRKHAYQEILQKFADGSIDILVGTQMITKGLDFDHVALVGILNADTLLHYPDFRANERAFQLMLQVAGRAGRRNKQGNVLIQTFDSQHKTIQQVMRSDYEEMYADEITERQVFKYPPFYRFIEITVKGRDYTDAKLVSKELAFLLKEKLGERVLGPEIPTIGRIKNYFLFTVLIKIDKSLPLPSIKEFIRHHIVNLQKTREGKRCIYNLDVDPY